MTEDWTDAVDDHGIVVRRDAVLDRRPHEIGNAAARGRLVALQRGLYVPAPVSVTARRRAAAAVLVLRPTAAVASHSTAARVHGIPVPEEDGVEHVTVARASRRPHHARLRIHTGRLGPVDVIDTEGVAVTAPGRTIVDLVRVLDRYDSAWALDQALHTRSVTTDAVLEAATRLARAQGVAAVRGIVAAAEPRSGSWLETRARTVLLDAGLPRPHAQVPVVTSAGTRYVDLGYPDVRIGIEIDGRGSHDTPDAVYADRHRQNAVQLRGWTLLRFTWFDVVRRPEWVVDCVRRALAAASAGR